MDERYAVAVGYNFGLVPAEELAGIKIDVAGSVRYEGENRNYFKGVTYEDSRKIDALLDRYGELPIKDYKIKPVIMRGEVEMVVPGFDKERDGFTWGGYSFVCGEKTVPFDFSGIAWNIEQEGDQLLVSFETGRTGLLTDYFLDDCYEGDYLEMGLQINDVTAEFLSKATAISEFMVFLELDGKELWPEDISQRGRLLLKSLSFSDGEHEYSMNPDVLHAYNQSLCKERTSIESRIQAAKAKNGANIHPPAKSLTDPPER